jgi:hypothetical protein
MIFWIGGGAVVAPTTAWDKVRPGFAGAFSVR